MYAVVEGKAALLKHLGSARNTWASSVETAAAVECVP